MSTIIEKLKLNKFQKKIIYNIPGNKKELFSKLQFTESNSYDMIFAFVFSLEEIKKIIQEVIDNHKLNSEGYLYFAYPKKGNKEYSNFIHRDDIFGHLQIDENYYIKNTQLKFSKMVSLDETFTVVGIRNVQDIKKVSSASSQCVDDYIEYIDQFKNWLKRNSLEVLDFYESLPFGYQKDWCRYIYSAKKEETIQNRLKEALGILLKGYKTRDLYRSQAKK